MDTNFSILVEIFFTPPRCLNNVFVNEHIFPSVVCSQIFALFMWAARMNAHITVQSVGQLQDRKSFSLNSRQVKLNYFLKAFVTREHAWTEEPYTRRDKMCVIVHYSNLQLPDEKKKKTMLHMNKSCHYFHRGFAAHSCNISAWGEQPAGRFKDGSYWSAGCCAGTAGKLLDSGFSWEPVMGRISWKRATSVC